MMVWGNHKRFKKEGNSAASNAEATYAGGGLRGEKKPLEKLWKYYTGNRRTEVLPGFFSNKKSPPPVPITPHALKQDGNIDKRPPNVSRGGTSTLALLILQEHIKSHIA